MNKIFNINRILIIMGLVALSLLIIFWFWWGNKEITVTGEEELVKASGSINLFPGSSISGINCENSQTRPVAVMMPSDPVTRPLSGIASADMVFEMPVTPGGVTRMMAVFQCDKMVSEIGSIRSAREDFIPLAAGLDAIYVHWGGEKQALAELNSHVIDNIDALKYENIYFYRKKDSKPPHNGFTDFPRLKKAAEDLKYSTKDNFAGYPHLSEVRAASNVLNLEEEIEIDYPPPFNVRWMYLKDKNMYKRIRGGAPEIDRLNNSQVEASVVAVLKTDATFTNKDYLTVHTTGTGNAVVYQNGTKISGTWRKDASPIGSKLFFYDSRGEEIELIPGKIWVQIIVN